MDKERFHWVDYLVFFATLLLSMAVGIYYATCGKKQGAQNTDGFLLAGKTMPVLPVSISIFVSWLSAISFIGKHFFLSMSAITAILMLFDFMLS